MKQSMRKKIQSSMILVITLTMLIAYAITTLVVYRQTIHIMEGEVRQEADYINVALDTSGESYLKTMDNVHVDTRITLIDPDGKVKYDSKEDDVTLQNHKNRPEVKAALKNGSGQDIRESNTLNKEMFYYAVKLENGDILRVSKTVDTAFRTAMKVFPAMGLIALIMLAFAGILVKWQVTRLIRPINRLDLENPLENDVYEELTPLLQSIDKQNKEKDAVANMRKEFSANVSHELKTPLTSMVGYIELIKREELSDIVRDYVDVISERAEKLKEMINSLFNLAKASSGNVELHPEPFEVNRMIEQIFADMDDRIKESHLEFVTDLTKEDTQLISDNSYFYRICQNLIENALKYSAKGTRVFVKTKLLQSEGKEEVWLEVTNTSGYPMDFTKEDIIERFARGDKARTGDGNGLGLAIVSTYAKALGGEFDILIDCDQFKACLKFPKKTT